MTLHLSSFVAALAMVPISASTIMPAHADELNESNTSSRGVTADHQGSSKSDVEITRQIRRQLVKNDSLSSDAHNVKIYTRDGKVTLKGPVKSDTEKNQVEQYARDTAGTENVHSDLQITS